MNRVVSVSILVASLAASWGCGLTKRGYLAKGNTLYAAGKYDDASLNYRKAIQKDPNFADAYYHLGLTATKSNQALLAYEALLHAVQLSPGNMDAKEKLGDVCLSFYLADPKHPQALYSQITNLSDELLSKNGNSYEGLMLKGYLASTDGKLTEAIEFFRKALHVNPSNAGVVTELAHLLIRDGQVKEGEELAMDLIARQKTSYGRVYDLMYGFYINAHRVADAQNVLKTRVSSNPKQAEYILELARHFGRLQKTAEMQATLHLLLDDPATFPEARLQVGDFYMELRDYGQAIHYYQEGLGLNPDAKVKAAYQKRNVIALLSEGMNDAAIRLAEEVVKENPKDNEALHLHAGILLKSGKRENADVAVREFQTLAIHNPNDAPLLLQLGQAYRLKGDSKAAAEQFVQAINKRKDLFAARYELAEISLMQQRPVDAVQQANKILELRPNDRRARLLRTAALIAAGDVATGRAELAQLIKELPRDLEPQLQLGLLAVAEQKYSEAINTLSKHLGSGDQRVYTGMAVAYLHQKQTDKAREILNAGLRTLPDSPMLIEHLADTEALAGHYDLAIEHLQKLLTSDPKSAKLRLRLAEVYGRKGDPNNEVAIYQQAQELEPTDPTVALSLAGALAQAGRTNEARAQFQRVVKEHPENAPALNNAAFFLADTGGDLDEALRLARHALEKSPGQPGFSDTVGYIYLKKGLNDSAVQTFSNLARKYPQFASFRYHLGLALIVKGDKAAARKELQAALSDHPSAQDRLRIRELLEKIG
jgi:tetratricopeptide (TPR) repeat protein